jgi:hypothetical protein
VLEAVFSSSSTGFRTRAAQGQAHGLAEPGLADHGFVRFAERAAVGVFFTFFPSDCRICGSPLIEAPRLPVKQKQAQRGLNRAEMISRAARNQLSRPRGFELCTSVLRSRLETGSQIGLTGINGVRTCEAPLP